MEQHRFCPVCKSKDIDTSANAYYLDHTMCECSTVCRKCGNMISHWAYGYSDWDMTRTDYIKTLWFRYKLTTWKDRWIALEQTIWILTLRG